MSNCDNYKIEIDGLHHTIKIEQTKQPNIILKKEKFDEKIQQSNNNSVSLKKIQKYNEKRELRKEKLEEEIRLAQIIIKQSKQILDEQKRIQKELFNEQKRIQKEIKNAKKIRIN